MARVLGYGVGNTNGARSFAGKATTVIDSAEEYMIEGRDNTWTGDRGLEYMIEFRDPTWTVDS